MAAVTVSTNAATKGITFDHYVPGLVLAMPAKYDNDGAKDANSIVQMLKVPAGSVLLGMEWKTTALGAGVTIDIGISTDVDLYVDGADVSAAASGAVNCINEKVTAETTIQIKVLGGSLPDNAVLEMTVYYMRYEGIENFGDY